MLINICLKEYKIGLPYIDKLFNYVTYIFMVLLKKGATLPIAPLIKLIALY
ncbi:MAG: hypothetical protein ACJAX4_001675 [Clostridium sp.]|jgi:hypothetical protein